MSRDFIARTITTSPDRARSVFAIDVDGDGDMDVLSADYNEIVWYENDGSQSFTNHTIITYLNSNWRVYAIDMDGDGDIDVLTSSSHYWVKDVFFALKILGVISTEFLYFCWVWVCHC